MLRSTKIVATLGPASSDPAVLERMVRAGVDVVRLNFSHGTAADHEKRAELVKEIGRKNAFSRTPFRLTHGIIQSKILYEKTKTETFFISTLFYFYRCICNAHFTDVIMDYHIVLHLIN
jgi:hypothetical protein